MLTAFVGREHELGELTAALEESISGHGRLFMLAGEPGIGKTRTTQELASYAENRGVRVLWGRSYEVGGAPAYWPWVQAMRSYVQQVDAEQLIEEMGDGAPDIAEIVPTIRGKIPNLGSPPALDSEAARFRLFDSITTFLKNASQSQPLMIVLDDLHWADRSSTLLLEFFARELENSQLLLVGCYRDSEVTRQHPLSQTLAQLSREPVFRRQVLGGLSQDDLGQFIETTTGIQVSQELTETLYAHTEGNPFFMSEVIRLLSESGELTAEHIGTPDGLRIPEGIRNVVGQRLNRLSEERNEVLTNASIIGREFDFRLLQLLSGEMSEDQLLQAVDEAMSLHLIDEVPGQIDRYQFSHALIQQTLADELSSSRRVRLHARIGQALEALYGDDVESHAAELAYHFAQAETLIGTEKVVQYALLAGEQALAAYAYEDALAHFERALAAKHESIFDSGPALDSDTAAILFGMGHAQLALNHVPEALLILTRAFDYYVESEDVSRAVIIAQNSHSTALMIGMCASIARAIQVVPPDSVELGHILANHGYCLGWTSGGYDDAQDAFSRALAIARGRNDAVLELQVLANSANIDGFHLHWKKCLANSLQALEQAPGGDASYHKARAHLQANTALLSATGDIESANFHALELRSSAESLHDAVWLPRSFYVETNLFCVTGQWSSARERSDEGIARFPTDPLLLGQRAYFEHQVGDVTQADDYLSRFLDFKDAGSTLIGFSTAAILARIYFISGNEALFDIIQHEAQTLISSGLPYRVFFGRCSLAITAVRKGDASRSADLYSALDSERGTFVVATDLAVDHLLGLLSRTMGNLDQAVAHFVDAVALCRKAGYRPELAWTCSDYAEMLLDRPDPPRSSGTGDREKAIELQDEALAITQELEMRPLTERILARREILRA
jgi:tetratricopeptide (TPR) repeat protein